MELVRWRSADLCVCVYVCSGVCVCEEGAEPYVCHFHLVSFDGFLFFQLMGAWGGEEEEEEGEEVEGEGLKRPPEGK